MHNEHTKAWCKVDACERQVTLLEVYFKKVFVISLKKPGMNCLLIDILMDLHGTNILIKSEQAQ